MLKELSIKNFAIIDDLKIDFTRGLNLLTGETGSGKSIIIEALGIVLGGRGSKDLVRSGKDKAIIEALFYIEDNIKGVLLEYGVEADDNVLIISREISTNYPSISRINSRPISLSVLSNITTNLVDIFGQHEHQSLLNITNHQILIDSLGDKNHRKLLQRIKANYEIYIKEKNKLGEMNKSSAEREREIDLLKYQMDEIDDANLTQEDDFEIENGFKRLLNIKDITIGIGNVIEVLYEDGYDKTSALGMLGAGINIFSQNVNYDSSLEPYLNKLNDIRFELEDISRELINYLDNLEIDEEKLQFYSDRLDLVNKLKKKYGYNIEKIQKYRVSINIDYENLINYEMEILKLKKNIDAYRKEIYDDSLKLREERKNISKKLEEKLSKELSELNMGSVIFKVDFKEKEDITSSGLDQIEFMIATNPGEKPKPLSKIVSGGEMSRIMLGLKNIMADNDEMPTLIFDEIDTGISGRTAQIVGEKICKISKNHQVISISHLPQIVALADSHFVIYKDVEDNKTITKIERLSEDERIIEMARLLGGVNLTQTTLNHAKEMLIMSKSIKAKRSNI